KGNRQNPTPAERCDRILRPMRHAIVILLAAGCVLAAQPPRRLISLIVVGGTVITQNDSRQILSPGAVAMNGAEIVAVDRPEAIAARFTAVETIEARDQIVLPGLINTHTH